MVKYRKTNGNKSWNKCGERTILNHCYLGCCTRLLIPVEISVHEDPQKSIPILGRSPRTLYPATEKFAYSCFLLFIADERTMNSGKIRHTLKCVLLYSLKDDDSF